MYEHNKGKTTVPLDKRIKFLKNSHSVFNDKYTLKKCATEYCNEIYLDIDSTEELYEITDTLNIFGHCSLVPISDVKPYFKFMITFDCFVLIYYPWYSVIKAVPIVQSTILMGPEDGKLIYDKILEEVKYNYKTKCTYKPIIIDMQYTAVLTNACCGAIIGDLTVNYDATLVFINVPDINVKPIEKLIELADVQIKRKEILK